MLVECKECKSKVSHRARKCPKCGIKDPGINYFHASLTVLIIIGAIYLFSSDDKTDINPVQEIQVTQSKIPAWHEGGNLDTKGALDWQNASEKNKLASCAELISRMFERGLTTEKFGSFMNNEKNWKLKSVELKNELDVAFEKEADADLNDRLFANQKVLDTAVILAMAKGWISNG